MPAQKTKKKVAAKTVAPSRMASKPSKPTKSVHPLQKHYFMEEQEEFFRRHPLAQMLITIFILSIVMFFVAYYFFAMR